MAVSTSVFNLDSYLESDAAHMEGRPVVRGTGVSVQRIGILYSQAFSAEAIAQELTLDLPAVHAAICLYLANRAAIEADIDEQEAEGQRLMEAYLAANRR